MNHRNFLTVEFLDDNQGFNDQPFIKEHFDTRAQADEFVVFVTSKLDELGLSDVSHSVTFQTQQFDFDYVKVMALQSLEELKQERIEDGVNFDD